MDDVEFLEVDSVVPVADPPLRGLHHARRPPQHPVRGGPARASIPRSVLVTMKRVSTATPVASNPLAMTIGATAVVFSCLYLASDLLELVGGGFSTFQLVLTYVAEAAIPLFVLGLYSVQRPHIGTLGLVGAAGYAYAYIFFTGTVVVALVEQSPDWDALVGDFGPWVTVHGLVMVLAGCAFGAAVVRAGVLPWWTGVLLIAGVVMVALASPLPGVVQVWCAGVRDVAFAAMGLSVLTAARSNRSTARPS